MRWLEQFKEATPETKWFILNWVFYGAIIILTSIYCYARLDFVRSGPTTQETQIIKQK